MSGTELFGRAVGEFDARMKQVRDDQWENATPCSAWNVRDLVNHIVYEARWMPELLAGKTIEEVGDRFDGDLLGDDPHAAWASARDEELAALSGLNTADKKVHVSSGQIAADDYLDQLLMDHLIHGWDLARGVGGDERLDPQLVEHCYARAKENERGIRGAGVFGDAVEVPTNADSQTKLLALLGREA